MFDLLNDVMDSGEFLDPGFGSIGQFFAVVINLLMGISFSISIITIVWAGFLYANSAGDPKRAKTAGDTLLWGAVAAAVTLGAVALRFIVSRGIGGMDDPTPVPTY